MKYEEAVTELYFSMFGNHPTNFHSALYRLIEKADHTNREKLRLAYPDEVMAWEEWHKAESESEFFLRGCGLIVPA